MYHISAKYFMSLYVRPSAALTSLSKETACLWCHKYSPFLKFSLLFFEEPPDLHCSDISTLRFFTNKL